MKQYIKPTIKEMEMCTLEIIAESHIKKEEYKPADEYEDVLSKDRPDDLWKGNSYSLWD